MRLFNKSWSGLLRHFAMAVALLASAVGGASAAPVNASGDGPVRIKDLGRLQGWRDNALVGYGIVTGLAGTGDSPSNRATRQAMSNLLSQFGQAVPVDQVQSRNVAVVMVTASLPVLAREGDTLDVTVTSSGDARSLVGGSLLMTPLRAANGRTFALAQGPLSVGGYRYDANGNVVQKNHPTVGSVPGGATVEVGMPRSPAEPTQVTFVLGNPDYTTAMRVANAINSAFGTQVAEARDASGIEIRIPEDDRARPVAFLARVESVSVEPDRRAKVVINERTGTVVAGGDVRIQRVAVSHGDLRVSIATETSVSQPITVGSMAPNARTAIVTNSQVDVTESPGTGYVASGNTVADLVQALARMRTNTRDIISVLRAVKAAGALHAELVVQ
ncbi:MAG TPA: flagellar basal body P-ring protein FlgI [Ideonella sp.]|uniref:flagellar basal body P-ring protein FlgI n=1 Tax=Ideonella sp. TaxID=1929293 RepID=UPI002E3783BA|nr:flagellar basal body P-ring protein FlgI [Ideonella sp.]HEX5682646.1 flagellar basal body P-ring protein FlgI [Ideonella sp.]